MEILASLAVVLVTGLFIITFIMQAFAIPSSSMEDTLLIGDHVFVNRVQFSPRTPGSDRSCLIVRSAAGILWCFFLPPSLDLYVVKRIIGIPGTTFICAMAWFIATASNWLSLM